MKNSSSLNAAKQEANLIVELFQKTDEDNGLMRYGNAFAFLDAAPRFYRGDAKYTPIDRLTKVGLDREFVFNGSKYFISISPMLSGEMLMASKCNILFTLQIGKRSWNVRSSNWHQMAP